MSSKTKGCGPAVVGIVAEQKASLMNYQVRLWNAFYSNAFYSMLAIPCATAAGRSALCGAAATMLWRSAHHVTLMCTHHTSARLPRCLPLFLWPSGR